MPNELPLPDEFSHLLEKRENEDRRQGVQNAEDPGQQDDRRSGKDRRDKAQPESNSGSA